MLINKWSYPMSDAFVWVKLVLSAWTATTPVMWPYPLCVYVCVCTCLSSLEADLTTTHQPPPTSSYSMTERGVTIKSQPHTHTHALIYNLLSLCPRWKWVLGLHLEWESCEKVAAGFLLIMAPTTSGKKHDIRDFSSLCSCVIISLTFSFFYFSQLSSIRPHALCQVQLSSTYSCPQRTPSTVRDWESGISDKVREGQRMKY